MVMLLGNDEGIAIPGLVGATNPFPHSKTENLGIRRLIENRMALLSNATLVHKPTWNDVTYAYVNTHHRGNGAVNPKLLFTLNADRLAGMSASPVAGPAQSTTFVDPVSGRTITWGSASAPIGGSFEAAGVTYGTVPSIGTGNVAVNMLCLGDAGVTSSSLLAVKYTDSNNKLHLYRTSATNLRLERTVASANATEVDITVVNATDPIGFSAIGFRVDGTLYAVFINGRKVASGTLSAGAQGLAGTSFGVMNAVTSRTAVGPVEVFSV